MPDTEKMLDAPVRYLQAFTDSDLDGILALYADDAVVEDPVGTPRHEGKDAIRAFYERGIGMGAKGELSGPVRLAGNEVAFPFVIRVEAANMEIDIIDVFRFNEEGLVVEMRAFWGESNTRQG